MANIVQQIIEKREIFSKKQLEVASYVVENYKHVGFMTATTLAAAAGVSQPTVIRFAQLLGFSQYQQFVDAFRQMLKADLTSTDRLTISYEHGSSPDNIPFECICREVRTLEKFSNEFPQKQFNEMVDAICNSSEVIIVGTRGSAALAQNFSYFLAKVKKEVKSIVKGGADAFEQLLCAKDQALVIPIAFPRYPRETVEMAGFCESKKMNVFGISDKIDSPLGKTLPRLLVVPVTFSTLFDSYCPVFCLFSAIVTQVGQRNRAESETLSRTFEAFAKARGLFIE